MQGPETSGKNPVEEMGEKRFRAEKLERVNRKLGKYKSADDGLDSASVKWEVTFNATKEALMVIDNHFTIAQANLATSRLVGKPLKEIIGQSCWQVVHGTNQPPEECPLKKALANGQHEEAELYLPEKDIWAEVSVDPIIDKQGKTNSAVHIIRNITERKKNAETLHKSQEKHRAIFEGAMDGIVYVDRTARVIDVNPAFTEITGIPREDVVGKSVFRLIRQFVRPKDIPQLLKAVRLTLSGKPVELYELDINNKIVEISTPSLRKEKLGITGVIRDISDRRKAEEELRQSEKRFRDIFENSLIGMYQTTPDGRILMANSALVQMLGYSSFAELATRNLEQEGFEPGYTRSEFKRRIDANGLIIGLESAWRKNTGTTLFVRESAQAIRDEAGNTLYYQGTVEDITERKKAERKLADDTAFQSVLAAIRGVSEDQSEQQTWKVFLESLVLEYDFKMAWFGSHVEQKVRPLIWAGRPGAYLDGLVLDISEPTSPDAVCAMSQCILLRQPFGYANLAHDPGFKVWRCEALDHGFGSNMALPFIVDGRVEGGLMVYAATTHGFSGERTSQLQSLVDDLAQRLGERRQRERARQAVQESKKFLRDIFNGIRDGISVLDRNLTITQVNKWIEKMHSQEMPLVGQKCYEVYQKRKTVCPWCPSVKAISTGKTHVEDVRVPYDDSSFWCELSAYPLKDENGNVVGVVEHVKNITERKQAEEALRESEAQLKRAQEVAHVGSWYLDLRTDQLTWSDETYRIFGVPIGQPLTEADFQAIVYPDDLGNVKESWAGALRGGSYDIEHRIVVGQTIKWVREKAQLEFDAERRSHFGIGIVQDITERKHAEQIIRQSEEFLNSVIENTPNPMWLSDEKGTVIRMNQALRELLKVKDEEIIGRYNILRDKQLQEQGLLALVEKVFTEGRNAHFEVEYDTAKVTQVQLKEHVYKTLELTLSPLRNIEGVITNVICQYRDITERKRAETELRAYQAKLKAMASEILRTQERERQSLAVGLHDDICQKLVLTKLALESALCSTSDAKFAGSLRIAAETIGEIIRQAESLTFELSNPVLREFGFVAAVEKYLAMEIRRKHGIAYELETDEHLGSLRDEIKTCLFRVTRELLTNVVKHARAQKVIVSVRKTQDEIHVTIQDDGVGFDPAKVKGEDPGSVRFGLFSVREQLEHLGGLLIIESKPGRGTVATVVI